MAFGGGGGFTFGSTSNNPSSGFSGFGSNTSNTGGFGSSTSNTGFGSSTAPSNPFGGSTFGSNTSGGFGSPSNTGSIFGNKAASNPFGSTSTGGGLFGSNTNTGSGFGTSGGFGSNTSNAFGNTPGSSFSFGGNTSKPAFGSSSSTTPLFGQGGAGTTGAFGSSGAFGGAGSGTALGQTVPPSEGTAVTPFAPTNEKDSPTATTTNSYQSITFMQPYQKYSFEELRLADYNAGRRFGNASGQAGAFGSSTFGGFGASNTGAFGSTTTNPFGTTATTSGGFGTTPATSGFGGGTGLFGNKPATGGGLFGQQSSGTTTGSIFGTASNTSPFGGGGTSGGFGASTGTGLFGSTQAQNKPSPFGGAAGANTGFTFGGTSTGTGGGGVFGTANAFGASNQPSGGGGLFGNLSGQSQTKSPFGTGTGGGFGVSTTQSQPAGGLFGSTTTGTTGGLFGGPSTTSTGTGAGLFGNTTNTGTSLFGTPAATTAAKPGGLFGGGTFGSTNAPSTGGGLFGNAPAGNQPSGGFFGNTGATTSTGFNFGTSTANKPATSLFGSATGTTGGTNVFGQPSTTGGLFGASQLTAQQQQQQQQEMIKHSSLLDPNPYGQSSIWTGLPVPSPETKPVFTPLAASQKAKESQSKPPSSLRLNQSRYMTPPRRGFGFSYSTYGTPNSVASTPGGGSLTGSMYASRGFTGGSFGRSFGKSASVNNLRSHFAGEGESVLSPGAFAPSASRYSSGSIRRLTIDRSIRNDLFSRPSSPSVSAPTSGPEKTINGATIPAAATNGEITIEPLSKLKKRVSFDKGTTGGQPNVELNGDTGALVRTETENEELSEDQARRGKTVNGTSPSDNEPGRGNELAVVPEDTESEHVAPPKVAQAKADPKPGEYWMKPSRAEISKMPREKLQRFTNFEVGRKGCGRVVFNGPVDLTTLPLDDLYEKIVEIRLRSVTVYPEASSKPPVGKGLNVPSTIYIENSWPRAKGQPSSATSGPIFEKHIDRLRKMNGTEFVNYEVSTGIWTFTVPHYTRYGLDYDEDDYDDVDHQISSPLSPPPDSLGPTKSADASVMEVDSDGQNDLSEDDTFAFKKSVPGGFGRPSTLEYDPGMSLAKHVDDDDDHDARSARSDDESENEMSMAGSFPPPVEGPLDLPKPGKSILKATRLQATPGKLLINLDGDWAEQLQRTISPRKQNRDALRDVQSKILLDRAFEPIKPRTGNKEFRTSIDIMHSLFDKHEERMAKGRKGQAAAPDFEFPYAKRAKTVDETIEMSEEDRLWHTSIKPRFTETDRLFYWAKDSIQRGHDGTTQVLAEGDGQAIVLTSLDAQAQQVDLDIQSLLAESQTVVTDGVPFVQHNPLPFSQIKERRVREGAPVAETDLYELAHVLFDDYEDEFTFDLSRQQKQGFRDRIRKDRLNRFLASLVWTRHGERIRHVEKLDAATAALLHLAAKNVQAACDLLMEAKDFHLMMLVAQIEQADDTFQQDIRDQLDAWREQNIISEMTEEIRALYEVLSGNTTICRGKPNAPTEDRATTFAISEKFELDWLQAFCLSLWYGKEKNSTIEHGVRDFVQKLESREESASPIGEDGSEDPLFVVLKLFASTGVNRDFAEPLIPQALSALSKPWSSQSTFRFHHAIVAAVPEVHVDREKADALATDVAFQCSASGHVAAAVYALLHLQDAGQRAEMVQDLLRRHAAALPPPPEEDPQGEHQSIQLWNTLTLDLKVPPEWIYRAKALLARASNDSFTELRYLILADSFAEAHECLCRRVAPRLVIDEDWETLKQVLASFGDKPEQRVGNWAAGGAIYAGFVSLVIASKHGTKERRNTLERMQKSLSERKTLFAGEGRKSGANGLEEREERVALSEMGRLVAELLEMEGANKKAILDLPLTADNRLTQARKMGVDYYRGIMATAR